MGISMDKRTLAVIVTIAFSAVGVVGDYFLKLASQEKHSLRSVWFYVGFAFYASTAFGWVFVMKHLKLGTVGVIYSVSMILLLVGLGVIVFGESLKYHEIAGLVMAIASLVLLMRFN
jgi:multidrug transporter EmrE-like cation transporter